MSDPANPQRVGGCETSGSAQGVAVSGHYAHVADGDAGLQVIDVSNPANPRRVGGYDTSGIAYGVAVSGHYAYVADSWTGLQVIDVNDPAHPQRVGGYDTGGGAAGVAVSGDYAYVADGWAGLQVIDVSDPANPRRVGGNSSFDGQAVCVGSDHVFVAAGRDGLIILHPFTPLAGPPLSFGRVQPGPTGVDLVLEGLPGLRVDLERSSDLHHWQSWTNTLLGTGPVELTDPETNPRQFYRAIAR
ncbi:MAG: hypothetical protein M5U12_11875 [Verrucomicrobia bacterium]|nr:hypothetical protein [Verrucomicrobiota bacterium]